MPFVIGTIPLRSDFQHFQSGQQQAGGFLPTAPAFGGYSNLRKETFVPFWFMALCMICFFLPASMSYFESQRGDQTLMRDDDDDNGGSGNMEYWPRYASYQPIQ